MLSCIIRTCQSLLPLLVSSYPSSHSLPIHNIIGVFQGTGFPSRHKCSTMTHHEDQIARENLSTNTIGQLLADSWTQDDGLEDNLVRLAAMRWGPSRMEHLCFLLNLGAPSLTLRLRAGPRFDCEDFTFCQTCSHITQDGYHRVLWKALVSRP